MSVSIARLTNPRHLPSIRLLGVRIDLLRLDELVEDICCAAADGAHKLLVTHVNITGLNLAYEQEWLCQFYNRADRVYCDGMGVRLGARLAGLPLPERYTLADWMWPLSERLATAGISLFLLGGVQGVAERAAANLTERFPDLRVAGAWHGYFVKKRGSAENEAVLNRINRERPGVLLVGFGMPLQERWLMENWSYLDARVAITCGALFEYLSGDLTRGPQWMTQYYLEWLARSLLSPRRYVRRYWRDIPFFFSRIIRNHVFQ